MSEQWRVRGEDDSGEGRAIALPQLKQQVADGVWPETAQVRGSADDRWTLIGDHPLLEEFLPRQPLLISPSADEVEMDMTPMIDVTFQLIIFFMITATFAVQKTLPMPEAGAEEEIAQRPTMSQLKEENIIVTIRGDGTVTVDDRPVRPAELADALAEASRDRQAAELVLDVADEVEHQLVVQVIDAAAGAQIEQIHFVRRAPPGG